MRRRVLTFCLLILASLSPPVMAQTPTHDEAVQLWEAMIAAKGGHERLRSIRSYAVSLWDRTRSSQAVAVMPDYLWLRSAWEGRRAGRRHAASPAGMNTSDGVQERDVHIRHDALTHPLHLARASAAKPTSQGRQDHAL